MPLEEKIEIIEKENEVKIILITPAKQMTTTLDLPEGYKIGKKKMGPEKIGDNIYKITSYKMIKQETPDEETLVQFFDIKKYTIDFTKGQITKTEQETLKRILEYDDFFGWH